MGTEGAPPAALGHQQLRHGTYVSDTESSDSEVQVVEKDLPAVEAGEGEEGGE